jgi:ABC-type Fe3+ transport system substrate-binding protein
MVDRTNIALALGVISVLISAGSFAYLTVNIASVNNNINNLQSQFGSFSNSTQLFSGQNNLYNLAKKEGNLIVYSTFPTESFAILAQDFSNTFPGITVQPVALTDGDVLTRVPVEFAAQKHSVDLIIGGSPISLDAQGMIMKYVSVQNSDLIQTNPDMVAGDLYVSVVAYNTNLMNTSTMPQSWDDLATAKYKGTFALQDPVTIHSSTDALNGLFDYWHNSTRFNNLILGLKNNAAGVYQDGGEMMTLLASGEYAMCVPCGLSDYYTELNAGANVSVDPNIIPVVTPDYYGIYKYAPDPYAAELFSEWIVSVPGQIAMDSIGHTSNRIGLLGKSSMVGPFPANVTTIQPDAAYQINPVPWVNTNIVPIFGSSY